MVKYITAGKPPGQWLEPSPSKTLQWLERAQMAANEGRRTQFDKTGNEGQLIPSRQGTQMKNLPVGLSIASGENDNKLLRV
jgi:hypothetical protein